MSVAESVDHYQTTSARSCSGKPPRHAAVGHGTLARLLRWAPFRLRSRRGALSAESCPSLSIRADVIPEYQLDCTFNV